MSGRGDGSVGVSCVKREVDEGGCRELGEGVRGVGRVRDVKLELGKRVRGAKLEWRWER